ncbi:MAG: hypothetical protein JWO42_251 [Chloroflexi bacterium]|nr:hypothetical protein [Chloroflexota bacterium]
MTYDSETRPRVLETESPVRVIIAARTVWLAATLLGLLLLLQVLVPAALGSLILIFIAIVFAEGIRPIMEWLHRRGIPRPLAVLMVYAVIALVLAGIVALLLTPVVTQASSFLNRLPQYISKAQQQLEEFAGHFGTKAQTSKVLSSLPSQAGGVAQNALGYAVTLPTELLSKFLDFVELFLLSFFWLTSTAGLKPWILSLFPEHLRDDASSIIAELSRSLGGYLRGTVTNMAAIALLSGIGYFIIGVPYSILLGIGAGLAEAIPILGPWIGGAVATSVALVSNGLLNALLVVALTFGVHLFEGNVLSPYVMYRTTSLKPLIVLISITIGGALFGLIGSVIGVPVAVVLQIVVLRILAPLARHAAARSRPAQPARLQKPSNVPRV